MKSNNKYLEKKFFSPVVLEKVKFMSQEEFSVWCDNELPSYERQVPSVFSYINNVIKKDGIKSFTKGISYYLEDKEWDNYFRNTFSKFLKDRSQ